MRLLITGGAGFVGSHLAERLVADHDIRILDNLTVGSRQYVPADVTFIEGDIRNAETITQAVEDVDVIFHLAALVSVDASIEDPQKSHAINVEGTLNILEASRDANARVVLASSAAIYGHPDSTPISETHSAQPNSPYGLEKLALDQYAQQYHDLYGLDTVALRYFNIYGPRQTGDYAGVISVFFDQARREEPINVNGDGTQTRDFVFIDDVVEANLRAMTTDAVGQSFNIGTGSAITIRELAEHIRAIVDSDSAIVHTDPRPGDIQQSCADISRARSELSYDPAVSLDDGLDRTAEWLR